MVAIDKKESMVYIADCNAGWSSLVARRAHNPKVGSSNLPPATMNIQGLTAYCCKSFFFVVFVKKGKLNEKPGSEYSLTA